MAEIDVARRYFAAWNAHDSDGIVATFAPGGTYADPTTPPLAGAAVGAYASDLFGAFPDLAFEEVGTTVGQGGTVAAQWVMRGTQTGPFGGAPPTGRTVVLPGADFLTVASDRIQTLQGYFDQRALLAQLGLQIVVQPEAAGPFTFGTSVRVTAGAAAPTAVSLTWVDARSEAEADQVRDFSRRIAAELPALPGFLSWTGLVIGRRLATVTAWADVGSARRLARAGTHREAMRRFFEAGLGEAVHTSVWVLDHANPVWIRCPACQQVVNYDREGGACTCGVPLPERPSAW